MKMNQLILSFAKKSNLTELYDRYQTSCIKNADDDILGFEQVAGGFAELIIQECLWQVVDDDLVPDHIQVLIANRIKQTFGIEQ